MLDLEAGGVAAEHALRVGLGRPRLVRVELVPVLVELEVAVDLDEVGLAPPQLRGVVPRHGRPEALVLVEVQRANLSRVAVLLVLRGGAELLDAVPVGGRVADLRLVVAIGPLSHDLRARAALHPRLPRVGVQPQAVLDDCPDEEPVGILRLVERALERVPQEVVAEARERKEDAPVVPYREDRPSPVGRVERGQVLPRQLGEGLVDVVPLGPVRRLPRGELGVALVHRGEEPVQYQAHPGDRRVRPRQRPGHERVGVGQAPRVQDRGERREVGHEVRRGRVPDQVGIRRASHRQERVLVEEGHLVRGALERDLLPPVPSDAAEDRGVVAAVVPAEDDEELYRKCEGEEGHESDERAGRRDGRVGVVVAVGGLAGGALPRRLPPAVAPLGHAPLVVGGV